MKGKMHLLPFEGPSIASHTTLDVKREIKCLVVLRLGWIERKILLSRKVWTVNGKLAG